MALLHDILAWSQASLKSWQQDAVRRLFQQGITAEAIDDLYAMLKAGVGIPDPHERKPQPLAAEHLPIVVPAQGNAARLISMSNVRNVNRLAPHQVLSFAPKGMTVIYGTNGAGKSGYARVLKRACRARDCTEDVRMNAFEKPGPDQVPQAEFQIQIGGNAASVSWTKNKPPSPELATIAVFDTHCARAYLDQNQEIAYLPSGLDVVENLAQVVMPRLLEKLNADILATDTSKAALAHLAGATKVGKLVDALSEKTPLAQIESLAAMDEDDVARMETLRKTLAEADPKAKAVQCRLAASRIAGLKKRIDAAASWVKDEAVEKLRKLDDETLGALAAETKAAGELRIGEELPGTGGIAWKALYDAAREFSVATAYPDEEFPHAHDGARCLLCQQEIGNDAGERLARFEKYVQESVAKVAEEKRSLLDAAVAKIEGAVLSVGLEEALEQEVSGLDLELPEVISAFDKAVRERQTWLLNAQKAHSWEGLPAFPTDPRTKLDAIALNFITQAEEFEKATDDKHKALLKAEFDELSARAALGPCKPAVLDLLERMRVKALLAKCKDELKTKPVSDKAKEFASNAVTVPLRAALTAEFKALGVSHAMPRLNESVERGKMKHKLHLDLAVPAQIRDILSEGEQRAIAVGSFLAELTTGGHCGGIIFDDPVSSLDHIRRQHVARRLVKEATTRQVIVFTHDTTFLGELSDLIDQHGTEHAIHYLSWEGAHSGKVNAGLPWHHQSFKDRIDKLQQAQKKLEKSWPPYPDEQQSASMRTQYSMLRATIERLIQDLVFNGVVVRYRDWIKVGNLGEVVGFDDLDCKERSNVCIRHAATLRRRTTLRRARMRRYRRRSSCAQTSRRSSQWRSQLGRSAKRRRKRPRTELREQSPI